MVFKIEKFKEDCAKYLANVTRVDGLTRMDLSRLRRGLFDGLTVKKFMIVCEAMMIEPNEYSNHIADGLFDNTFRL